MEKACTYKPDIKTQPQTASNLTKKLESGGSGKALTEMGLFGNVICVLAGAYAGIYLDQNYNIPKVNNPQELIDKIKEFMDKNKKD